MLPGPGAAEDCSSGMRSIGMGLGCGGVGRALLGEVAGCCGWPLRLMMVISTGLLRICDSIRCKASARLVALPRSMVWIRMLLAAGPLPVPLALRALMMACTSVI